MAKPYIQLNLDPQNVNKYYDVRIFFEDTPVLKCYLYNNNLEFRPDSSWSAYLSYASNDIVHDFTTMEGTITDNYIEFDIEEDFFEEAGDYYSQIYLKTSTKQMVISCGMLRVQESLFS